jgi:signal transduction histidine kinase
MESEEHLSSEILPEAFIRVGGDGAVVSCNARARSLLASLGEIRRGRKWRGLLPADEADRFMRLVGGLAVGAVVSQEFAFGLRPDATRLRVHLLRLAPGFSCTLQAIEREPIAPPVFIGPAEIWLPADFLARLTHELKTPISAAQAASFLLRNQTTDLTSGNGKKWLAAIDQAVTNLREGMEQIDTLNRTLMDPSAQAPELIEVPVWLESLVERAKQAAPASRVTLGIRAGVKGRWWLAESLLATALECLLSNALKFSGEGSRASIEVRRAGDGLEIVVADQGPGVGASEVGRLFTPFFRGRSSCLRSGCGLGLAIARMAVTRMGGSISYHRVPGLGTEFRVRVPARPLKRHVTPNPAEPEPRAKGDAGPGRRRPHLAG